MISVRQRRFFTRLLLVATLGSFGAVGAVGAAAPVSAAPATASFTGTVTAGGFTRAGVYVGLVDASSNRLTAIAVTDATGTYRFDGVAGGSSYRVVFVDSSSQRLRPQFSPGLDVLSKTLPVAVQQAAVYNATAGATVTVSAALLGADCDPTVMKPNGKYNNTILVMKDFTGCDLRGSSFVLSYMSGTKLVGAKLNNASFFGATLFGSDVRRANVNGTTVMASQLNGANFTGAVGRPVGHEMATFGNTTCPTGMNSDANGATCAGQPW